MDTRPRDERRFWNELMIQHCKTERKSMNGMVRYCLGELLSEPVSLEFEAFMRKVERARLFEGEFTNGGVVEPPFEEIVEWDWILERRFGRKGRGQGVI